MEKIVERWFVIIFLLAGMSLSVGSASAGCQVECVDHNRYDNSCIEWQTGLCGKSAAQSQGYCPPGQYQTPSGGCRLYGPTSGSGGGDIEPSGCECGSRTCETQDGGKKECWCAPACLPATCTGTVIPQNSVTDQTSGDFLLYGTQILRPANMRAGFNPFMDVQFWVEGPTGARVYYTGINDEVDLASIGNWHGVANLNNHQGYGVANIGADVYRRGVYEASCLPSSFTRPRTITGMVYYDPGNTCSTASPWDKTSNLIVGYNETGVTFGADVISAIVEPNDIVGKYVIGDAPSGIVSLQLLNLDTPENSAYMCSSCNPQGCPNIAGVPSPSLGNNFFLTDNVSRAAWWQVTGAGIYAGGGGTAIRSTLPDSSTNLILAETGGTEGAAFMPYGNSSLGSGNLSDAGWIAKSKYKGKKMDYAYFAANMGVIQGQASDWTGSDTFNLTTYPAGHDFGYMKPVSGTATIADPIAVGSTEKYMVFVNGNLDIANNITVADGGFLALIVNGNVNVDPSVSQVQGIYDMTGNYVSESKYVDGVTNDDQLEVQGSVVSWGTVSLLRNLGVGNTTTPGDKFVYRPDLLTNMPDIMKTFVMQWSEVVPGTFGQ